jgi:hypothetical protein
MTHFSGMPNHYAAYSYPTTQPRKANKPTHQEETTPATSEPESTTGKRILQVGGTVAASTALGLGSGYATYQSAKNTPQPASTEPPTPILQDPLKQKQKTPAEIQALWDAQKQSTHDKLRLAVLSDKGAFTPTDTSSFTMMSDTERTQAQAADIAKLPTTFETAEAQLTQAALERKTPYSKILKELEPTIEADVEKVPIAPLENDTTVTTAKQAFQQATETLETVKIEKEKLHLQALSTIVGETSPLTTVPPNIRRRVLMDRSIAETLEILKKNDFDEDDLKKIFSNQSTKQAFEEVLETKNFQEIGTHINGLSSTTLTPEELATAKELLLQNYVTNSEIALHEAQGTIHKASTNPSESLAAALRLKDPKLTRTEALVKAKELLNLDEDILFKQFGDYQGVYQTAGTQYTQALEAAHKQRWATIKQQLLGLGVASEHIDTLYEKSKTNFSKAVSNLKPNTITKSEQTLVKRILEHHHVQTPQGKQVVKAQAQAIWDAAEKEIAQKLNEAEQAFKNKHVPTPPKAPAKTAQLAGSFLDELPKGGATSKVAGIVGLGTLLLGAGLTAYSAYQDGNKLKDLQAERAKLSFNG